MAFCLYHCETGTCKSLEEGNFGHSVKAARKMLSIKRAVMNFLATRSHKIDLLPDWTYIGIYVYHSLSLKWLKWSTCSFVLFGVNTHFLLDCSKIFIFSCVFFLNCWTRERKESRENWPPPPPPRSSHLRSLLLLFLSHSFALWNRESVNSLILQFLFTYLEGKSVIFAVYVITDMQNLFDRSVVFKRHVDAVPMAKPDDCDIAE